MPEFLEKREALKNFFYEIKDCTDCRLAKSRTNFVFGSGSANAEIMFVGEAPGRNEDLQGKPFVGRAGKILDELLSLIDLKRKEVFIANVLKCKPPQNRDPVPDEINICKNHLFRQIQIIKPSAICTLGRYSTQLLLNTDKSITGLRGRIFKTDFGYIMPINHPAAVLYTPSRINVLKDDFLRLKELIKFLKNPQSHNNLSIELSPEYRDKMARIDSVLQPESGKKDKMQEKKKMPVDPSDKPPEKKVMPLREAQKKVQEDGDAKKNQANQMGLF